MNIRPTGKRILVQVTPEEKISKGGIYIPEETSYSVDKHLNGKVLAKGNKVSEDVVVGEEVIFDRFCGNKVPGQPHLILLIEENLLGKVVSA